MTIQTQKQATGLEQRAFDQRLESLGIKKKGDEIDPKSVQSLEADGLQGMEALQSVLQDGMLTAEGAAKLTKQTSFFQRRDLSINEKQSNALRSVGMTCEGLTQKLNRITDVVDQGGALTSDQFADIQRRTDELSKQLSKYVDPDAELQQIDPRFVGAFANSLYQLTRSCSEFSTILSAKREELLKAGGDIKTAFEKHNSLEIMGTTVSQLESIRAASALVTNANVAAAEETTQAPKDLDSLSKALQAKLETGSIESKEQAEARAGEIKELFEKFDGLNSGEAVLSLARYIKQNLPHEEGKTTPAISLLRFNIPKIHKTGQTGDQMLVVTRNGLRAVSTGDGYNVKKETRPVDPAELAPAGLDLAQLEGAIAKALDRASNNPERIIPEEVELCRYDQLHTNGMEPSIDFEQVNGQFRDAVALEKKAGRQQRLIDIIEDTGPRLSGGEFIEWMCSAFEMMERVDGYSKELTGEMLPVVDKLIEHAGRFGFDRYDLGDVAKALESLKTNLYRGRGNICDDYYSDWLSRISNLNYYD